MDHMRMEGILALAIAARLLYLRWKCSDASRLDILFYPAQPAMHLFRRARFRHAIPISRDRVIHLPCPLFSFFSRVHM
jgi:hypothetical protein